MSERDSFIIEAAIDHGFQQEEVEPHPWYRVSEDELLAFAKSCIRAGQLGYQFKGWT